MLFVILKIKKEDCVNNLVAIVNSPVISGLIVTVLSAPILFALGRLFNRERYKKKVKDANKRLIQLAMDYLLTLKDMEEFNDSILVRIRQAVSIEHRIKEEALHTTNEVYSIIIIESLEMRMFPNDFRSEIFDYIIEVDNTSTSETKIIDEYKLTTLNSGMILIIPIITFSLIAFLSIIQTSEGESLFYSLNDLSQVEIFQLVIAFSTLSFSLVTLLASFAEDEGSVVYKVLNRFKKK